MINVNMTESQVEKNTSIETSLGGGGGGGDHVAPGVDDAGAIPKGTMDPVYEAKARVLNRAVRLGVIHPHSLADMS